MRAASVALPAAKALTLLTCCLQALNLLMSRDKQWGLALQSLVRSMCTGQWLTHG